MRDWTQACLALTLFCGMFLLIHPTAAQTIRATTASPLIFTVTLDSLSPTFPEIITISPVGAEKVEYKFNGAPRTGALIPGEEINFVVVAPSTGVAPRGVRIAPNPNIVAYLAPGRYDVVLDFQPSGLPSGRFTGPSVALWVLPPPPPRITSVVSSATLQPTVSPGELVSIFGANIGTPPLSARYDSAGLYPTELGHTTVTFNNVPAPMLYVSTTQINTVVPFAAAGQKTVDVVVTHRSRQSPPFSTPLLDTSPGIFTLGQNGAGQGAILNSVPGNPFVFTVNGPDNPAPKRSAISIFATGAGVWNPLRAEFAGGPVQPIQDGSILLLAFQPAPVAPVSLTIGGRPATILYAGVAPYLVAGTLQINAIVPDDIGSGPQPIVLTVGQNSNSQQNVTVAVQ